MNALVLKKFHQGSLSRRNEKRPLRMPSSSRGYTLAFRMPAMDAMVTMSEFRCSCSSFEKMRERMLRDTRLIATDGHHLWGSSLREHLGF